MLVALEYAIFAVLDSVFRGYSSKCLFLDCIIIVMLHNTRRGSSRLEFEVCGVVNTKFL